MLWRISGLFLKMGVWIEGTPHFVVGKMPLIAFYEDLDPQRPQPEVQSDPSGNPSSW